MLFQNSNDIKACSLYGLAPNAMHQLPGPWPQCHKVPFLLVSCISLPWLLDATANKYNLIYLILHFCAQGSVETHHLHSAFAFTRRSVLGIFLEQHMESDLILQKHV